MDPLPASSPLPPPDPDPPPMSSAVQRLSALRAGARAMLIAQRLGWLFAVALAIGAAMGIVDYVLRSPAWLRATVLAGATAWLMAGIWRRVIPAARFVPPLAEIALRVERSPGGLSAGLRGVLASGLELGSVDPTGLAAPVVAQAAARAAGVSVWRLVRPGRTLASLGAALAVVVALGAIATVEPALTAIGTRRVLLPWSAAQWPKRSPVADATGIRKHPVGAALPLRAALLSRGAPTDPARVEARYRLIDASGRAGPVRRVALTSQERPVRVAVARPDGELASVTGTLFERLIEPADLIASVDPRGAPPAELGQIEYWFETDDDQTGVQRVLLVRPPVVVDARATVTPPEYAVRLGAVPVRTAELGPGNDERAALEGVLAGSRIDLTVQLSKPVPGPPGSALTDGATLDWFRASVGEAFASAVIEPARTRPGASEHRDDEPVLRLEGARWSLAWTAHESLRLPLHPVDEHGIESDAECVYRIDVHEDRPPEATVTVPAEDGEALVTASLAVTAEGRDDVALEWVAAEYRIARRPAGSESAAPEPTGEETEVARTGAQGGSRVLTADSTLDLGRLTVKPGDEIWLTALAADAYLFAGQHHQPVRSAVRRIRVISQEQFVEQVWAELAGVRRAAIRLAEQQARAAVDTRDGRDGPASMRDQTGVTDGAARQAQIIDGLRQRVESNGVHDPELSSVLDEARTRLDQAREASSSAADAMRAAQEARAQEKAREAGQHRAQAQDQQRRAQDAIESLAELLDRGQDAWAVRRAVERLIADQRALRESTLKAGEETVGRAVDELTPAQRQQIAQLGDQQEDLARRADEAVRKTQAKADAMQEKDPSGAAALSEAARKAQRDRLAEQLERTARDIRANREQAAAQQQDRAVRALEEMLDTMQSASRTRDETLARELSSLIDSIGGLIARQEDSLRALAGSRAAGPLVGLDGPMIALRTQTLGVAEQARAAGREAHEVASLLDDGAGEQARSVVALRAVPPDAEEAQNHEQASLARLQEARDKAQEAQRQAGERNVRRQRAELKKIYHELLDEQTDLRTRTQDVVAMEAGRRQRAAARELAQPQDQIRQKAAQTAEQSRDIGDSELFRYAHERLDGATGAAVESLSDGQADTVVIARQSASIRVLQGLLEALADAQRSDEFREQPQGGAAPGQDQGRGGPRQAKLIPDSAELRLLRAMQAEALAITRESSESGDAPSAAAAAADAGRLQTDLVNHAEALIRKLKQRANPPAPKPVEKDDKEEPKGGPQ